MASEEEYAMMKEKLKDISRNIDDDDEDFGSKLKDKLKNISGSFKDDDFLGLAKKNENVIEKPISEQEINECLAKFEDDLLYYERQISIIEKLVSNKKISEALDMIKKTRTNLEVTKSLNNFDSETELLTQQQQVSLKNKQKRSDEIEQILDNLEKKNNYFSQIIVSTNLNGLKKDIEDISMEIASAEELKRNPEESSNFRNLSMKLEELITRLNTKICFLESDPMNEVQKKILGNIKNKSVILANKVSSLIGS